MLWRTLEAGAICPRLVFIFVTQLLVTRPDHLTVRLTIGGGAVQALLPLPVILVLRILMPFQFEALFGFNECFVLCHYSDHRSIDRTGRGTAAAGCATTAAAVWATATATTVRRRKGDIVHWRRRQTTQVVIILLHYQGWPSHAALEEEKVKMLFI